MEEASLLRETEGKLFEGNLFRLEVEELLTEVRVDHGKKSVKALEVREREERGELGGTGIPSRRENVVQGFPWRLAKMMVQACPSIATPLYPFAALCFPGTPGMAARAQRHLGEPTALYC